MFAGAESDRYEAWFLIYDDFVASGVRSPKTYAEALSENDTITTKMPKRQTEDILLAIKRCVGKYGTINSVKSAHAKWAKENGYAYVDVSNLKKFAPEGQRAKSDKKDTKQALYETVSLNRAEAVRRFMAGGQSRAVANANATLLGIK